MGACFGIGRWQELGKRGWEVLGQQEDAPSELSIDAGGEEGKDPLLSSGDSQLKLLSGIDLVQDLVRNLECILMSSLDIHLRK